mgnify:CR=1 FL=1
MSVVIRDADLARDRAALECFIVETNAYEANFESNRNRDPAFAVEHLQNLLDRAGCRIFVAEEVGRLLGWAMCHTDSHEVFVKPEERPFGYVAEMYVVEAARGRHVGRTLLKACEDHFRALGMKSVLIGALSGNTRALNAYRAAGYNDYAVNLRKLL